MAKCGFWIKTYFVDHRLQLLLTLLFLLFFANGTNMMPRIFLMMFSYLLIFSSFSLVGVDLVMAVDNVRDVNSPNGQQSVAVDCRQLLDRQDVILEEVRHLNRELALLRYTISKPGVEEIFAGLGYILGLFGVAFFVLARKKG